MRTSTLVGQRPPVSAADSSAWHAPPAFAPVARSRRCCVHSKAATHGPRPCQPATCLWGAPRCLVHGSRATPAQHQQQADATTSCASSSACRRRNISSWHAPRPGRRKQPPVVCRAATATLVGGGDDDGYSNSGSSSPSVSESAADNARPGFSQAASSVSGDPQPELAAEGAATGDEQHPPRSCANTAMIALRCGDPPCNNAKPCSDNKITHMGCDNSGQISLMLSGAHCAKFNRPRPCLHPSVKQLTEEQLWSSRDVGLLHVNDLLCA